MAWMPALCAAVLAASVAASPLPAAAQPRGPGAAAVAAADVAVPTERVAALLGVGPILSFLGDELLGVAFEKVLDSTGLFEAIGLGNDEDEQIKQRLDEVIQRLDALDAAIASLHGEIEGLEQALQISLARTRIAEQQARFETCFDRLRDLARARSDDPEIVARHNQAMLARAYQVVGLPSPDGLVFSDDYCALLGPLTDVQRAVLPEDPHADRPMIVLAEQARARGLEFEEVLRYFGWVVGIQRQALAIVAEAHHRLGEDALLDEVLAESEQSLARQELELLRAAEAYALAQPPFDAAAAAAALELADAVVAWMEGAPRVVTAGLVLEGDVAEPWGAAPQLLQGELPALPMDGLASVGGEPYYGTPRAVAVAGHVYVQRRPEGGGVEVGWSDRLTVARYRTTAVAPRPAEVTLVAAAPVRQRALALGLNDAADLATQAWSSDPLADADRQLLAHSGGLASSCARFQLLPSEADPRLVTLAVDEPAWGLAAVPVGPVDGGGAAFAARPAVAGAQLELVPYGPAEPERFALRAGGGWLGLLPAAAATADNPEPALRVATVDAPVYFDLVRRGEGYEVSVADGGGGPRRFLYVNAQRQSASDWQAATSRSATADLRAEAMLPVYGAAGGQPACTFVPNLINVVQARKLSLDVHGGGARAVTYRVDGRLSFTDHGASGCSSAGRCFFTQADGGRVTLLDWEGHSNYWGTAFNWFVNAAAPGWGTIDGRSYVLGFDRTLSPGQVENLWCEVDSTVGSCDACASFSSLSLTVR